MSRAHVGLVAALALAGCSAGGKSEPASAEPVGPDSDAKIISLAPAGTKAVIVHAMGFGSGSIAIPGQAQNCVSYDWEDNIHYSQVCWAYVATGASVTVDAVATNGSRWLGWGTGPCAGSKERTCSLTMSDHRISNVGFDPGGATGPKSEYALSVHVLGFVDGDISATGASLACQESERASMARTCFAVAPAGTQVTLTAQPRAGTTFSGWGGNCTGTGTCTVTMDRDLGVTAGFAGIGGGGTGGIGNMAGTWIGCRATVTATSAGAVTYSDDCGAQGTGTVSPTGEYSLSGTGCLPTQPVFQHRGTWMQFQPDSLTIDADLWTSATGWVPSGGFNSCVLRHPTPSVPVISSFTASPDSITAGQSATLSWSVTGATSLSISGIGTVTGTSVMVEPAATTTYTLTATNAGEYTTRTVTVMVTGGGGSGGSAAPDWAVGTWTGTGSCVTSTLTATSAGVATYSDTSLAQGTGTLDAAGTYALTGVGSGGVAPFWHRGTWSQIAANTMHVNADLSYDGVNWITNGGIDCDFSRVVASQPVISTFTASPASITTGQTATLAWSVTGATTLSISGIGDVTGTSVAVTPAATTIYTLTATNANGSVTATQTVTVQPAWPSGRDGALLVTTGQTVTLVPGGVYDYSSVHVQTGGTLVIAPGAGAAAAWTFIGSTGPFVVNGNVIASGGQDYAATLAAHAPADDGSLTGEVVSYSVNVASGGDGGAGGVGCDNNGSGCQLFGTPGNGGPGGPTGNGGGGGGGCNYHGYAPVAGSGLAGSIGAGGNGGTGGGSSQASGGGGATGFGAPGGAGTDGPSGTGNGGGGGGGGHLGLHGQGIYIKVRDPSGIGGTGRISVAGGRGGSGGTGGTNAQYAALAYSGSGGGGGGGAGGSGGAIVIRLPAGAPVTPTLDVSGGPGGAGALNNEASATWGKSGRDGQAGAPGPTPDVGRF